MKPSANQKALFGSRLCSPPRVLTLTLTLLKGESIKDLISFCCPTPQLLHQFPRRQKKASHNLAFENLLIIKKKKTHTKWQEIQTKRRVRHTVFVFCVFSWVFLVRFVCLLCEWLRAERKLGACCFHTDPDSFTSCRQGGDGGAANGESSQPLSPHHPSAITGRACARVRVR